MSRPSAPERPRWVDDEDPDGDSYRPRPVAGPPLTPEERRRQLELARARMEDRHNRIMGLQTQPRQVSGNRWRRFAQLYGWRAYALPVLVILTVLALFTTTTSPQVRRAVGAAVPGHAAAPSVATTPAANGASAAAGPAEAPAYEQLGIDPGDPSIDKALKSFQLPAGAPYTKAGNGSFNTIPGTSAVFGTGPLKTFSIEVEQGITGVDLNAFAATVMGTLEDPHSWIGGKDISLQRKDTGLVDFHIQLTSSMTVRKLCGYTLPIETSCYTGAGAGSDVVLNVARWVRGAAAYYSDIATYRVYAVNHEVGHALGHYHAHQCLSNGLAPVMMQQTIGLKTANGTCKPNQWPYPDGASDAPGAEQSDPSADTAFAKLQGA